MAGAYRWVADECEVYELPPRYRPESVSSLCRVTRFSEEEVKRLYRGFKAECPSGVIREDTFKIIYSQFFSARGKYIQLGGRGDDLNYYLSADGFGGNEGLFPVYRGQN